jgi:hypothetical protein
MASALVSTEPRQAAPCRAASLLEIDAGEFRDCFDRRPFLIRHRLAEDALFALPRLLELCRTLPAENVEYNAGNIPVCVAPELTPRNGLSAEETIRRIAECKSWLVLKYVEHDPDYRALLHRCLAEVAEHSEPIRPGMCLAQGFIFITSPGSVTPYHMDPEHNFLLQIRGTKQVSMFNPRDRSILSEEELERFYDGAHRNMVFKDEYQAKASSYDLRPGDGLHFPVTAPHYVRNGAEVSISFSITFRTPDLDKRTMVYNVNAFLRRRGLRPAPVGQHPWRDALKCALYRAWRRTRGLFGGKVA